MSRCRRLLIITHVLYCTRTYCWCIKDYTKNVGKGKFQDENKQSVPACKSNLVHKWDCKRNFLLIFPIQSPSQFTYALNSTIIPHTLDYQTHCLSTFSSSHFLTSLAVPVRPHPSHKLFKPFLNKQQDPCIIYHTPRTSSTITQHNTTQHSKTQTAVHRLRSNCLSAMTVSASSSADVAPSSFQNGLCELLQTTCAVRTPFVSRRITRGPSRVSELTY